MVQRAGQQQYQNKLNEQKLDEQKRQYERSFEEQKFQSDRTYGEGVRRSDRDYKSQQDQFDITNKYNDGVAGRAEDAEKRLAAEASREQVTRDNDEYVKLLNAAGYVSPDGLNLNYKMINDDIAAGRNSDRFGTAEQIVLGFATKFGGLPEGSKATAVEPLEGGGYAITVTNADGSKGVVTEDGTSDPNSKVVRFAPGQLGRLANTKFRTKVLTDTSQFNAVSMNQSLNKIDADAKVQAANDAVLDFLEEQKVINTVTQFVEETGDTALIRGTEEAIADGGIETAQLIGQQIGVLKPETSDSTNTDTTTAPVQVATMWSMDSVDRKTQAGRYILAIEGRPGAVTKPSPARVEKQRVELGEYREELVNKIKTSEANRASFKSKKPSPEKDGVLKDKAELAMIDGYLDKDKVAVFTEEVTQSLGDQLEGLNGDQIEAGVNDGSIVVDKKTQAQVAAQLQREGIREKRDLLRLAARDAAIARAAIIASSEDVSIRKQMSTEITNIFDNDRNSPSMNRNDERTLANSERTNNYRFAKLRQDAQIAHRGWVKEATVEAQTVVAGVNTRYFGENYDENNLNADTARAVMKSKEMSDFQIYLKNPNLTPGEIQTAVVGLKAVMSTTMAALAGDQTGGPWESIMDLIGRDETTDVVDPFDFDASRILVNDAGVDKDGRSKATKIYYTDADGNYTDEDAGLEKLKALAPSFYANLVAIGVANRRAKDAKDAKLAAQG